MHLKNSPGVDSLWGLALLHTAVLYIEVLHIEVLHIAVVDMSCCAFCVDVLMIQQHANGVFHLCN